MDLSAEQQAIINAPLAPLAVIACAGSGKTATAVRRLVEMRRLLADSRARVALLSFSNVAVDTFRQSYQTLAQTLPNGAGRSRVDFETLDGFITSHILRPHAYRTMGSQRAAFLVTGTEPFLSGFTCRRDPFPLPITDMKVGFENNELFFYYDFQGNIKRLDQNAASLAVRRLGRTGAYTHDLGRYWAYHTLIDQPLILRALVRRYPHVLVDESQDIGLLHQAILELLMRAGVQVSLIGDPNQSIYEFAGANGMFLRDYHRREEVTAFSLTRNYRSRPSIQAIANHISGRNDEPHRPIDPGTHGVYFIGYSNPELPGLLDAFHAEVANLGMRIENAAILCRSSKLADQLAGVNEPSGRGIVKHFVEAALHRDMHGRFQDAYKAVVRGIVSLLDGPPQGLLASLSHPAHDRSLQDLRRRLWAFSREVETGLPSSELPAMDSWHPLMLARVRTLLQEIHQDFGMVPTDNLGHKLARTGLPAGPLGAGADLAAERGPRIRVGTVHHVKGESIDAVLYVATRPHLQAMLDGVETELGRIGYVAVTRACNLLWLAVPSAALREMRPALLAAGFQEAGDR
ncbi:ATP-dependent DNA helicase [Janthinobacterium sp. Marseille]|uniref:UvrD-helicase domain-containing protein n=1 Tax=Herminiimonas aquatilis TaxID=345342 RepID=A0ABW2J9Z2_9BURK|nr:ATP-dependent helicase [Janthinobacterium sp. Marseille]ABR91719.1 ATP-dependent DNA helicase [Janthinobacterium sp. Marseille]